MDGAKRATGKTEGHSPQSYNGAIRAQLTDLQNARLIGAMFDVVTELGAANVTVAHIVERAGVSRRTFYELFADRDACFLAGFEQALALVSDRVVAAYNAQDSWRERIRSALVMFLCFLDEQPKIGRFLLVESLSGGPMMLERRNEVISKLASAIDQGRGEQKAISAPPLTGEGLVGGVLSILSTRLVEPNKKQLVELCNPLMNMIVLPYLGPAAARRELERPVTVPQTSGALGALLADPFKEAGMRLTYRTVRVLTAVANHPNASNREIGSTAGISDQGQISKLLSRLERIGLVKNTGVYPGKGAPNSWLLTEQGRQITDAIRTHTEDLQLKKQR